MAEDRASENGERIDFGCNKLLPGPMLEIIPLKCPPFDVGLTHVPGPSGEISLVMSDVSNLRGLLLFQHTRELDPFCWIEEYVVILSLLAMAAAGAVTVADQVHRTNVEHQGQRYEVAYRADTKVTTRQIGMSAGTRPSTERCLWSARVAVTRDVSHPNGAKLSHRLDDDSVMRGSHYGKCSENRANVATSIARRADDVRTHLVNAAGRDTKRVATDLRSAGHFAAN
ncbi:hypothetical protein [Novosphingobium sp. JCM 18896]|uniref:hypothetical protein n=1 Tax=Novosphingobium sp. JCM 18896 TaxID=2989731 RepID=UPI002221EFE1|nr:hypothetical protein [Novosphingobium sp. JCM 18896]MCW1432055.1 hypothetical protein [Novosphingobium sp. JCM 18896]